ncbi:MAG: hypothetical protein LH465_07340 [Sphingomonas bacterium]|nr:hypothetical protein [Sphingomonas bacterium]
MTSTKFLSGVLLWCVGQAALAAAPLQVVTAAGRWAALRGPDQCDAASLAVLPATRTRGPGRASLSFDRAQRRGQFAALLSRPVAPRSSVMLTIGETPFLLVARGAAAWSRGSAQDAAIIAAMRSASGMRIAARAATGARFVDRYELAGAPTAIDAAAACAATSL